MINSTLQLNNICFMFYNFSLVVHRPLDTSNSTSAFIDQYYGQLHQSETLLESTSVCNILYKIQQDKQEIKQ